MTPRSLTVRTCSIPARDCGRLCLVTCGRCRTNSLILSQLIIRPLVSAHLLIWENSSARVQSIFSETSILVSSAYLKMTLASACLLVPINCMRRTGCVSVTDGRNSKGSYLDSLVQNRLSERRNIQQDGEQRRTFPRLLLHFNHWSQAGVDSIQHE